MSNIDLAKVLADNNGTVPQPIALQLLTDLRKNNPSMKALLLPTDLKVMSQHMDFLAFKPGDSVIAKGADASWVGFIVLGGVDVVVKGKTVATRPVGKCLGGMALFFGGKRQADYSGGEAGGVVASLTFKRLEELIAKKPDVAVRLYQTIAAAELQNLNPELGPEKDTKKKKKKKKTGTEKAIEEVLYQSQAADALREKTRVYEELANIEKERHERDKLEKNYQIVIKQLTREIEGKDAELEAKDEEIDDLETTIESMQKEINGVNRVKKALELCRKELALLKAQMGNGAPVAPAPAPVPIPAPTPTPTPVVVQNTGPAPDEYWKVRLAQANEELKTLRAHQCPAPTGDDPKLLQELQELRKSQAALLLQHRTHTQQRNDDQQRQQELEKQLKMATDAAATASEDASRAHRQWQEVLQHNEQLEGALQTTQTLQEALSKDNATLQGTLAAATTELTNMNLKCGKHGVWHDRLREKCRTRSSLARGYFTDWLVVSLLQKRSQQQLKELTATLAQVSVSPQ